MISIEVLLGIIANEAVEFGGMTEEQWRAEGCPMLENSLNANKLPPIKYNLELIRDENGKLYWTE